MSTIRTIYHKEEPNFPATDQHPDAKRYKINDKEFGLLYIDTIGGKPTKKEITAVLKPDKTV